jgi:hypothetical protein
MYPIVAQKIIPNLYPYDENACWSWQMLDTDFWILYVFGFNQGFLPDYPASSIEYLPEYCNHHNLHIKPVKNPV